MKKILLIASAAVLLSGCSANDPYADLRSYVKGVEQNTKGKIPPPPEFKPYEFFTYSAAGMRSPFEMPVEIEKRVKRKAATGVKPDFDRVKERLEEFRIESLAMVGTIAMQSNSLWALIQDSDGGVHRVQAGNYMGKNYGRIVKVESTQIDMMEIVPDGQGGWLERPRTIMLSGLEQ